MVTKAVSGAFVPDVGGVVKHSVVRALYRKVHSTKCES